MLGKKKWRNTLYFRRAQIVVPLVVSTTHNLYGVIGHYSHFIDGEEQNYESAFQSHSTLQTVKAHSYPLFHLIIVTVIQVRPGQPFYLNF